MTPAKNEKRGDAFRHVFDLLTNIPRSIEMFDRLDESELKLVAKYLTYLGRCDKVSFRPKLVVVGGTSGGIVPSKVRGKALAHIRCYWDRTGCLSIL